MKDLAGYPEGEVLRDALWAALDEDERALYATSHSFHSGMQMLWALFIPAYVVGLKANAAEQDARDQEAIEKIRLATRDLG